MKTFEELIREKEEERRRKEEEYARWRMKNLGECYSSRLDYDIGEVYHGVIGEGIQNVLKPGDKVLAELYVLADPCFIHKRDNEVYVEGSIPVVGEYCKCSDIYIYEIYSLPLHIRGVLPKERQDAPPPPDDFNELLQYVYVYNKWYAIAEYKGNGILEIVPSTNEDDYDYYLPIYKYRPHTDSVLDVDDVTGAVWYSAYDWSYSTMHNLLEGGGMVLSGCCDAYPPTLIVPMLVRRGEEAKMRFSVDSIDQGEERYEVTISTKGSLPVVERKLIYKEKRDEDEKKWFCGC